MGRFTVHYADNKTNNALKKLHNKLRPAGTPVQRVEYIIELLPLKSLKQKFNRMRNSNHGESFLQQTTNGRTKKPDKRNPMKIAFSLKSNHTSLKLVKEYVWPKAEK